MTTSNAHPSHLAWVRAASWRRLLLLALIVLPTVTATRTMAAVLPHKGDTPLELALTAVFAVLFGWISIGFWTASIGALRLCLGRDAFAISLAGEEDDPREIDREARTAILVPVFNEDPERVFAGVRTVYDSLERTGRSDLFDIFILSDTPDPDGWVEEEAAWFAFCREKNAFGKIFYRRRRSNAKRKSGNVADFCRRWGKNYRYMIVFDADSVMAGETMLRMVGIMERRPDVGILQTPPAAVNRESLLARVQQFANHVYGPMFAAGLHFWQLGDAQYWGHNAIIRVHPFMEHCQLPRLPGKGPLGGDILSHDFVEAALMRRAGFSVWLAYDLRGSYEETPPTLLDELKRDRRWCQGNLQHLRLLFTRGLFPAHRALFLNGIMSYGSALLWFVFLLLSSVEAVLEAILEPKYFSGPALFPDWPVWYPHWAITLLASTAVVLFLPKLFAVLLIVLKDREAHLYGGAGKLAASVFLEVAVSTLLAPVRMFFHTTFVVTTLLGRRVTWGSQIRSDRETSWGDALRAHWLSMVAALLWGGLVHLANPTFFWWISPVLGPLALGAFLSVFTSGASLGRLLRRWKLLLIPEESDPPRELRDLEANQNRPRPYSPLPIPSGEGFVRAVADPVVHQLHTSLLLRRRRAAPAVENRRLEIEEKALALGPGSLSAREKMELLLDPFRLAELHRRVWELPGRENAARWGLTCFMPSSRR
jgi:membrane glycosyltransferase